MGSKKYVMEDFFLDQDKTNNGVKMPLFGPDGTLTDQFLLVRSQWSNHVKRAKEESERKISVELQKGELSADEKESMILDFMVSMVAGWSFEAEPTPENIKRFLVNAPQEAARLEAKSIGNTLFFLKGGSNSKSGAKKNSN